MAKHLKRMSLLFSRCIFQKAAGSVCGRLQASLYELPKPQTRLALLRPFSSVADVPNVADEEAAGSNGCAPVQDTEMTVDDFKELATSEEVRRQIHLILLEYVSCRDTVGRVPSVLTVADMTELLRMRSQIQRTRYFNYLFKTEMAIIADKRRKEKRRLERLAAKEEKLKKAMEDGSIHHIQYGIDNTLFLFIRDQTMNSFYNYRQAYAAMFGQTLVFDLDYEQEMTRRELINAADQLQEVYAANRANSDPFNLVFCNLKEEGDYRKQLHKAMGHLGRPGCLVTVTEKSYLDLYPKEKLVYLTPDARQPLRYSDDAIYIIGAMVDLGSQKPISMARAKRQGINFARLPLDEYLHWGQSSSKTLALQHMTKILLDMKATKNWSKAFDSIPRRKLKTAAELEAVAERQAAREHQKQRVLKKFKSEVPRTHYK